MFGDFISAEEVRGAMRRSGLNGDSVNQLAAVI